MPTLTIQHSTLHYQDHGTGFPVLLGHSYLWDAAMWAPQIDALSSRYRVIVPDLWGHGASGPLPAGTQTLDDLAAHASALLDALEIEQCAVVGLSVGGMWGARLALREPRRVRSLVLMDASLEAEPDATRLRYFAMLDAIEAAGSVVPPLLDAIVPLFFRPDVNLADPVPSAFRAALAKLPADRLRESIAPLGRLIFGRPDTLAALADLDGERTLLMCGAGDMARPPSETVKMASVIGCRHALVPDAGHISNLENPAFVTRMLLDWFDEQQLAAG
ncbi:alpha/beta hydrolase family protein [Burkholderia ambifaria AMMD]|uniref:Alpha/beta hydrolase fold protein n=1 Tax=Burkholderia ambifaria (strain ATCC BAA-244 / DSM 16087 / CCUG 44356 / LMG 19182 / AMMD) TaxID=339670 RepID=Q0B2C5_BURCM|nr:alpha/beta fold hydrolase [Burkholderia ambifaria]ABI91698.1 alpha/beta hydrolase fold protein [Burkholderia ambifaria AMMD]AJY26592.1 alpha/beta hydrolase family protein [Burkholderia ambifaria AMMD]MBR7933438.1 alpha/beta fold hydrolase [Burkholderia ambifaria]PEH70763.1 2-succinyl-6-hydroxy-2,4-cyclohexadiene-1-carboxylate synthase [Burkholderia ambifaria]QQC08397.1 alpha/beta fold hydrolase [Burkholderia ambifaria]